MILHFDYYERRINYTWPNVFSIICNIVFKGELTSKI